MPNIWWSQVLKCVSIYSKLDILGLLTVDFTLASRILWWTCFVFFFTSDVLQPKWFIEKISRRLIDDENNSECLCHTLFIYSWPQFSFNNSSVDLLFNFFINSFYGPGPAVTLSLRQSAGTCPLSRLLSSPLCRSSADFTTCLQVFLSWPWRSVCVYPRLSDWLPSRCRWCLTGRCLWSSSCDRDFIVYALHEPSLVSEN